MNFLKQNLAPITAEGWEEINDQAKTTLNNLLSARKFIDIDGPHGIDFAAVSKGRLAESTLKSEDNVNYGIHKVQPLIEIRRPFELNLWELDNASRGASDVELDNLEEAAHDIAQFEEKVIFEGFETAGITGLKDLNAYEPIPFPSNGEQLLANLGEAVSLFQDNAIEGPYSLVVGKEQWKKILSFTSGYPISRQIKEILGGKIIRNAFIDDAYLVSERGDDFKLTLGQDISIGFDAADNQNVKLFFTESFTFEIFDENAILKFS